MKTYSWQVDVVSDFELIPVLQDELRRLEDKFPDIRIVQVICSTNFTQALIIFERT